MGKSDEHKTGQFSSVFESTGEFRVAGPTPEDGLFDAFFATEEKKPRRARGLRRWSRKGTAGKPSDEGIPPENTTRPAAQALPSTPLTLSPFITPETSPSAKPPLPRRIRQATPAIPTSRPAGTEPPPPAGTTPTSPENTPAAVLPPEPEAPTEETSAETENPAETPRPDHPTPPHELQGEVPLAREAQGEVAPTGELQDEVPPTSELQGEIPSAHELQDDVRPTREPQDDVPPTHEPAPQNTPLEAAPLGRLLPAGPSEQATPDPLLSDDAEDWIWSEDPPENNEPAGEPVEQAETPTPPAEQPDKATEPAADPAAEIHEPDDSPDTLDEDVETPTPVADTAEHPDMDPPEQPSTENAPAVTSAQHPEADREPLQQLDADDEPLQPFGADSEPVAESDQRLGTESGSAAESGEPSGPSDESAAESDVELMVADEHGEADEEPSHAAEAEARERTDESGSEPMDASPDSGGPELKPYRTAITAVHMIPKRPVVPATPVDTSDAEPPTSEELSPSAETPTPDAEDEKSDEPMLHTPGDDRPTDETKMDASTDADAPDERPADDTAMDASAFPDVLDETPTDETAVNALYVPGVLDDTPADMTMAEFSEPPSAAHEPPSAARESLDAAHDLPSAAHEPPNGAHEFAGAADEPFGAAHELPADATLADAPVLAAPIAEEPADATPSEASMILTAFDDIPIQVMPFDDATAVDPPPPAEPPGEDMAPGTHVMPSASTDATAVDASTSDAFEKTPDAAGPETCVLPERSAESRMADAPGADDHTMPGISDDSTAVDVSGSGTRVMPGFSDDATATDVSSAPDATVADISAEMFIARSSAMHGEASPTDDGAFSNAGLSADVPPPAGASPVHITSTYAEPPASADADGHTPPTDHMSPANAGFAMPVDHMPPTNASYAAPIDHAPPANAGYEVPVDQVTSTDYATPAGARSAYPSPANTGPMSYAAPYAPGGATGYTAPPVNAGTSALALPPGPSAYVKTLGETGPASDAPYRGPFDPPGSSGGDQNGPPTGPKALPSRPKKSKITVLVAAGIAIVLAGGVAFAVFRDNGKKAPACPSTTNKACASQAGKSTAPVVGPKFAYRTVERDVGYFEGTIMIVNRTGSPLARWTLSFTYPGADVHNAWEVTLRQPGQYVIVDSKAGARPIAPGASFEVRFGGAGRPVMPVDCEFNGQPCGFTR